MYVFTRDWLGQAPMLSGSIAGMLGEDVFPTKARELLNKIGNRPEDHKKFLMIFDLEPFFSLSTLVPKEYDLDKIYDLLFETRSFERFEDELRGIVDDLKERDAGFKQQWNAELKLQIAVTQTIRKLGEQKLKPFLQVLAKRHIPYNDRRKISLDFAQRMLPKTLVQQITSSEFSEAHLNNIAEILNRYAIKRAQRPQPKKQPVKKKAGATRR
ncbi:MAG: hypothetical protein ACHBNF_15940 [Chromatiales bacterium]